MADTSLDIKMQHLRLSDSPVPALIPDNTPAEAHASGFEATTPPFEPSSPTDQEAEVEELLEYDTSSLKSVDVKTDPILAEYSRKQARPVSQPARETPSSVAFKARPAPSSTRQDGLGPRMTKSAALRQGLDWTAVNSPAKDPSLPGMKLTYVPGQKREAARAVSRVSLPVSPTYRHQQPVASLTAPSITPRQTKSSTLRTGVGASSSPIVKKDYAAQAIANKAKGKAERDQRRKSVILPPSLSAPSIVSRSRYSVGFLSDMQTPRQNRSSALRTGDPVPSSGRTLTASSADNVGQAKVREKESKAGLVRRASVGVKSLGTPSIVSPSSRISQIRDELMCRPLVLTALLF